eukprot:COSAG01_NODE_3434_length_6100_cov_7.180970_8_plen_121_part_00
MTTTATTTTALGDGRLGSALYRYRNSELGKHLRKRLLYEKKLQEAAGSLGSAMGGASRLKSSWVKSRGAFGGAGGATAQLRGAAAAGGAAAAAPPHGSSGDDVQLQATDPDSRAATKLAV